MNQKLKRKLHNSLLILAGFSLALGSAPFIPLQAKEKSSLDELKEALLQNGLKQNNSQTVSIGFHEKDNKQVETASLLPEKFDLRAVDKDGDGVAENYVSSIKMQDPWGTCWSFGVMAAVEATLAYQYDTPVEPDNELDLSERHLAYFTYTPIDEDEPNGQGGEGGHLLQDKLNKEMEGGFSSYATSLFSSGIGPVMESDAPYQGKEGLVTNQYGQTIRDGKVYDNQGNLIEEGDLEPYCYSPDDDWSLDKDLRFVNYFTLQNSSMLPEPVIKTEDEQGNITCQTDEKAIEAVKKELVEGRAVSVSFCADQAMPGDGLENAQYLQTENWAHYTYDGSGSNHIVCIVGYDDTYSKENFLPDHQPPKDGAFICKNSWGAKGAGFPAEYDWGIDGSGYFYLSYYDTSMSLLESYDFDYRTDLGEKEYTIGQYDLMPAFYVPDVSTQEPSLMANVFKAPSDILIRALSTQTATANTTVTFDLYRLNKDYENPMDGELVASCTQSFPYAGYHRINLDKSYAFAKDSPLSIVVTTKRADGSYEINYDMGDSKLCLERYNLLNSDSANSYVEGVVNPGESFWAGADEEGTLVWSDWADTLEEQNEELRQPLEQAGYFEALAQGDLEKVEKIEQQLSFPPALERACDNFPIKYYADFAANELPFKDLGFDSGNPHWAVLSGDIPAVLSKGLMTGKSEFAFGPDDVLKRAEAAMTLFRLSGESDPEKISSYSGPSAFKDVNVSAWYGPAMNWAAQNNIFVGSNGCVRPDDPISRQDLATILYRYAIKIGAANNNNNSQKQKKTASSYLGAPDAKDVSNWAMDGMVWAYENGLITGYQPSGSLLPKAETKRGEYAKILMAAIDVFNK